MTRKEPLQTRLRPWLQFSRKDRVGLLVLLALIIVIWLLPRIIVPLVTAGPGAPSLADSGDSAWLLAMNRADGDVDNRPGFEPGMASGAFTNNRKEKRYEYGGSKNYHDPRYRSSTYNNTERVKGFWFDPNSLDSAGLRRLGLRPKTIGILLRFRAQGGKFREPADLAKIYGLFPDEVERLTPWVRIVDQEPYRTAQSSRPVPVRFKTIDINTADTSAFIALPLIGSKLAVRIIAFRDKLGGFYSIDQLREVYGIRDSTFDVIRPYLVIAEGSIRAVNINSATIDEMKQHPYIRYPLASQLVAYRTEHGSFHEVRDLKNMMSVDEATFGKLEHYLVTK